MCFYLDETQKERQKKCLASNRLIISAEQIAIADFSERNPVVLSLQLRTPPLPVCQSRCVR